MRRVSVAPSAHQDSAKARPSIDQGRRKSLAMFGSRKSRGFSLIEAESISNTNIKGNKGDLNLDQVTANVKLTRLQSIFDEAHQDGTPGLSLDEFKVAIKNTTTRKIPDAELEMIFMKMDANCDGTIDWEEYVTYNLLEYKEKSQMLQMLREHPFPNDIKEVHTKNHEAIVRVAFYPHLSKRSSRIDYADGKYVTLTRDGIVSFWNLHMKHVTSFHAAPMSDRNTQPWFVEIACLYINNMLAIASTERDISFFDMSTKTGIKRYVITGLEDCVTCMDCKSDMKDKKHVILLWGDTAGNIYSVQIEIQRGGAMFGSQDQKKDTLKKVSFAELLRGYVPNVKAYKCSNIHDDWVVKVQFIPEIKCFFSCCQSSTTSFYMGDFNKKKLPAYAKVNKGLLCFDYCPVMNVIATGGMDYNVRIWNPYVLNRAIVLLKGHSKPICHIVISGKKNMLFSIDKGKSIRVYDLKDQTCVQHLSGRLIKLGPFSISAIYFNQALQHMVLATNQIALLEHKEADHTVADVVSHTKPVVAALYNATFSVLVSACEGSVISVWDINDGEKIMQFINAHSTIENGVEIPVDITAVSFDAAQRRVITGARDGSIKMWNFNNGACLQTFEVPDKSLITGIVSSKHRIYVTGWSRNVNIYVDGGGNESRKTWQTRHKDDILSIAYFSPNMIATSSYDGDIIVWSRETGQMYCRLNAHEGILPLSENFNRMNMESREDESETDVGDTGSGRRSSAFDSSEERSPTRERKYSFRDQNSPRKSLRLGLFAKSRLEELPMESGSAKTTPVDKCEHPLLSAFEEESSHTNSGKWKIKKKFSRDEYENLCRIYEAAVEKVLFLTTRESQDNRTAILITAGADGWIRAWSIHHQGGLLGQFIAAHKVGESISALTTDDKNRFLITADTCGYVKIWDLLDYCTSNTLQPRDKARHIEKMKEKFTYLRVGSALGKSFYEVTRDARIFETRPPPIKSRPEKTMKTPRLLNSFRAHVSTITNAEFINGRDLLITTGSDCSIRLWTICGRYIGTFGERWKHLPKRIVPKRLTKNIPKEIKRTGSARTLRVLNGGSAPHWELAISLVKQRGVEQLRTQLPHLRKREAGDEPVPTEDISETSNILGRSYKRKVRHKMPPVLSKVRETPSTIAVYHTLPFVDLSPVGMVQPPEVIEAINQRRLNSTLRASSRNKVKPGVISLYNNVVAKPMGAGVKHGHPNRMKKIVSRHKRRFSQGGASPEPDDMRNGSSMSGASSVTPVNYDSGKKSTLKLPSMVLS